MTGWEIGYSAASLFIGVGLGMFYMALVNIGRNDFGRDRVGLLVEMIRDKTPCATLLGHQTPEQSRVLATEGKRVLDVIIAAHTTATKQSAKRKAVSAK